MTKNVFNPLSHQAGFLAGCDGDFSGDRINTEDVGSGHLVPDAVRSEISSVAIRGGDGDHLGANLRAKITVK